MFRQLTLNLGVNSVGETVEFYRDAMDFELIATVPETKPFDWAMMSLGKISIMFQSKESLVKGLPTLANREIGGVQTFYVDVDDIQRAYYKVKGKAKILVDLSTTFYGTKEFTIEDPNGYAITFAQDI